MKCVYNDVGRCNLFTNDWSIGICTNNEDCPYRKPITNADKIRAMTDEELAEHLQGWSTTPAYKAREAWLAWLKQEVQDD